MKCNNKIERMVEKDGKRMYLFYICGSTSFENKWVDGKKVRVCKRCGKIQK